ncbi:MAG TPA: ComEC/Rec2 family competence protein [Allosphingosinicella sp.]|nr:ComEC/Rec2 family competence protein [Allosphingosinicella sp.]
MTAGDARAPSIAQPSPQRRRAAALLPWIRRLGAWIEARADAERDQFPLWLPVGLGLGIAAWFALPDQRAWTAFLLLATAATLAPVALAPGTRAGRALSLFCLAASLGCGGAWWKAERVAAPRLERERMAIFDAVVETSQRLPAKEALRLVVRTVAGPAPPRLRINVEEEKAGGALRPGDRLRIRAWLMPPAPPAVPGAYDFARAAWFQRIGATGRALEIRRLGSEAPPGWNARLSEARQRLADHIRRRLEGGAGGIAAALATGDQAGIGDEDAEAMRRSGLAHLLSVSGLHLTAVVGAVMLLVLKLLALSPTLALRFRLVLVAAAAGALAGIAYTLLTGAEVPTIRACIASLLILLGIALGREALTLRLVAVGALAVLLFWPESLVGPSFQMSFAAIVAIVALHEHPRVRAQLARRDEIWLMKLGRGLLGLVLTGLAVEIALVPIALWHFHQSGLYGAFANIVAIPLTTFVVMPLEAGALLFDLAGLGAPLWWATGAALDLLLGLAHRTAAAPGAVAMLPTMPAIAFAAMVSGGLWLALWRTSWRRWGLVPIAAGAVAAALTPTPDLLISGDGRHLAMRTSSGELALLRGRAGDYVRDTLAESAGRESDFLEIEQLRDGDCSPDFCFGRLTRDGRSWTILASRSDRLVPVGKLAPACAAADILVSDRRLPAACRPRWLKADRALLARTGGLSIVLRDPPRVATVAGGAHPWQ